MGPWMPVFVFAGSLALSAGELTCDPERLDPVSYALTTRAQGLALTRAKGDWWDRFDIGRYELDLADLNTATLRAAQRAQERDPRNRMAYAILARQGLVFDEAEMAEDSWRRVLDAGGSVVWSGTLYDVDARTYFLLAFSRDALRVYRMDHLTSGPVRRRFYGIPDFPPPDDRRFYEAMGGCLDPAVRPEAEIPWSEIREIKAGNWVLWFKLTRPIRISSDRTGKAKTLSELKVNLHGRTGEIEVYKPVGENHLGLRGRGPAGFQDAVRRILVRFVDPEHRIALPPVKPGVGW
jgi:hypothetical protein